MSPFAD